MVTDFGKMAKLHDNHGNTVCNHGNPLCNHGNTVCNNGNTVCNHGNPFCNHGNNPPFRRWWQRKKKVRAPSVSSMGSGMSGGCSNFLKRVSTKFRSLLFLFSFYRFLVFVYLISHVLSFMVLLFDKNRNFLKPWLFGGRIEESPCS